MKDPDKAIVCGACKVPVVTPADPKPHDQLICPKCGARDTYEQVFKVIMDHAKYRLQSAGKRGIAKVFGKPANAVGRTPGDDRHEPIFKWRLRD